VAFFGTTPPPQNSQWILVSIDGGPAYNTSYMDPSPPSTRQWYQSPTLPDAVHNITVTHIAGTLVDYAVVTAGPSTNLSTASLMVDDGDSSITYTGNWTQDTNMFTSTNSVATFPFGNGTHQTSSTGDSATFHFTGMFMFVGKLVNSRLTTEQVPMSSFIACFLPISLARLPYSLQ